MKALSQRWRVVLAFAGIIILAAWLRLYHLGLPSLWHDEAYTWFFTRLPWMQMLAGLRADGVHPPLYYLLEKGIIGFLGDSEGVMRSFSVAVELISIPLAIWLGWQISGSVGGLISGWFWAFNPFTIWFAQEARPYALAAMLSLAALVVLQKMRTDPTRPTILLAGLILTLGLLTHFFYFLVVGILILMTLLRFRQSPALFRYWTVISLIAMIPLLLWVIWFFLLPRPMLSIGWITAPILIDLPLTIWNFLSGYAGGFSLPSTLFGAIVGSLLVIGLVAGKDAASNRQLFCLGILFPVLLTWLVSFRRPIYVDRYYIVLLPFLIPILASGGKYAYHYLSRFLRPPLTAILFIFILLFSGLYNAWQVHSDIKYAREDWRGLAAYLSEQPPSSVPFWFLHAEIVAPFEYYYHEPYKTISAGTPPACKEACWWVLRQPYTPTHAFTEAITIPERPWKPQLAPGCQILAHWDSPTGLAIWKIVCP
jgi:mannosyltransferase